MSDEVFAVDIRDPEKWNLNKEIGAMIEDVKRNFNGMGLTAVRKAMKRANVGVSGHMRASIKHTLVTFSRDPLDIGTKIFVPVKTSTGFYYASAVEYGTKPHRPPYNALYLWAKRKGVKLGAIVNHIAKYGTKAHPFLHPAVNETLKEWVWRWSRWE